MCDEYAIRQNDDGHSYSLFVNGQFHGEYESLPDAAEEVEALKKGENQNGSI